MKPTGPIPPYFSAAPDGQLLIGGAPAEELVEAAGGTPLFVYDNNIIGGQIARLRAAMPDGLAVFYAVTANPNEELLSFIGRYIDGFRVVSRGELDRLKRAGLAGIPITFAGPGKRDDELDAGIAAGATVSVESEGEARRAILAGERLGIRPGSRSASIRRSRSTWQDQHGRHAEPVRNRCRARGRTGPGPARGRCRLARPAHVRRRPVPRRRRADRGAPRRHHQRRRRSPSSSACRCPSSTLAAGSTFPCFDGEQSVDLYRLADAMHETLCAAPSCWRRPACRSSSGAGSSPSAGSI